MTPDVPGLGSHVPTSAANWSAARIWVVAFAVALAALVLLRSDALSTAYYWDEVGYYVPNAVSMYRNHFDPIPISTLTIPQSYPPLLPLVFALAWKVAGFSLPVTRIVVFLFAAATLAYTVLLGRELRSTAAGAAAAALTLTLPNFLGQTGLAQPEVPLALFTVAATYYLIRGRMPAHAVAVALLLMTKWTAVVSLTIFGLYAAATAPTWRDALRRQVAYAPGLVLLALWLAYFRARVGTLTSPSAYFGRANLWDNLALPTLAARAVVRAAQLVGDWNWLVLAPAGITAAIWLWRRSSERSLERTARRPELAAYALLAGQGIAYLAFLTVAGLPLPRYFVPVQPLLAVLGVAGLFALVRKPAAFAYATALSTLMLVTWMGWLDVDPPEMREMRTSYMRYVRAHAEAIRYLEAYYPNARVGADWPVREELKQPFLGYVSRPIATSTFEGEDPSTLDPNSFDLLFDSPVRGNTDRIRVVADCLGFVQLARFDVGEHHVILWGRPTDAGSGRQ